MKFVSDFINKDHIIDSPGGIQAIIDCLSSRNEETIISCITILIFLITPKSKNRKFFLKPS